MIHYEHKIPVKDYQRLRRQMAWKELPVKQAENAVNNCFYSLCCYDDEKVIGMIRLLWNGDYCAYITDVVVDEAYRGQGIAGHMLRQTMKHLEDTMEEGFAVKLFLMAAVGRESFYEQFGFERRPNETGGAAMDMWVLR